MNTHTFSIAHPSPSQRSRLVAVICGLLVACVTGVMAQGDDSDYKLGVDSQVQPDVPQGTVTKGSLKVQPYSQVPSGGTGSMSQSNMMVPARQR